MASQVTAGGPNGTSGAHGPRAAPKKQAGATKTNEAAAGTSTGVTGMADSDWTSEKRLVSALAMLQEMEAKIHRLRTLVPDRLLAPLRSAMAQENGEVAPDSPQDFFQRLSENAKDAVTEIEGFRTAWNGPDMKPVWDQVDRKLKQPGADLPQPTGMWEKNYRAILTRLEAEEKRKEDQEKLAAEHRERDEMASNQGGWMGIIDSFLAVARPDLTINILPSTDEAPRFSVLLHTTSTQFLVQNLDVQDMGDWIVSVNSYSSSSKTIEKILTCIRERDRKWDLPYLLDMFSSYVNVKQTPCIGCSRLLDRDGQLPTIRRPKPLSSPNSKSTFIWEPYHPSCT